MASRPKKASTDATAPQGSASQVAKSWPVALTSGCAKQTRVPHRTLHTDWPSPPAEYARRKQETAYSASSAPAAPSPVRRGCGALPVPAPGLGPGAGIVGACGPSTTGPSATTSVGSGAGARNSRAHSAADGRSWGSGDVIRVSSGTRWAGSDCRAGPASWAADARRPLSFSTGTSTSTSA
ncbi:hypothetical protein [Actinacidiphila sp. bgisy144]|uniref:hypothetical protein n=1 Tax=Actinacidiphila sp. bgisy144 TaxID=3413791 RepID=UPI003EBCF877